MRRLVTIAALGAVAALAAGVALRARGERGDAEAQEPARVTDAASAPDPELPYTAHRSDPVVYDVQFDVVFTPPHGSRQVRVWLPAPQSDAGQEVSGYATDPAAASLGSEPLYGNRLAYFEYEQPLGGQIIRQRYRVEAWELRWDLDPEKVVSVEDWPPGFERYLRSEPNVIVDERIRSLARRIVGEERNPALKARRIMDYVIDYLDYDHTVCSLQASAGRALDKKAGHCSDYHGLTASLARAVGIPSRIAYGIHPLPRASPSHCKNEMYFHPYGWVSFDVSETQKLVRRIEADRSLSALEKKERKRAALERLYAGFRDNTWVRLTVGTGYPFVPAASRIPPLIRTAYVEADGEPLPDPDPANPLKREFAWMTLTRYTADREVVYPF